MRSLLSSVAAERRSFVSRLLYECFGVKGDQQFFVGSDDHGSRGTVLTDDVARFLAVLFVAGFIDLVAENLEVVHRHLADELAVFANAASEYEGVDARESHGDAADFTGEPVGECFESNLGAHVAFACGLRQGAHVVRKTGEAEKARFLVYKLVETVDIVTVLLADEEEDGRVKGAGAGAHDEALERGEAHGGVNALAVQNGGAAGTVTEVSGNEAGFFGLLAKDTASFGSHETVAGAVGAVTADAVFFVELVGDAVEVGLARHGLVESGVEHGDLRERREELGGAFHTGGVSRFMQRGKQSDATNVVDDFLRDALALDVLTAVHHAVADSFDGFDELLFGEELLDFGDSFGVSGAIEIEVDVAGRALCLDVAVNADIFDEAARDGILGLGVDDSELHRRAAAVKYEYAHCSFLFSFNG